VWLEFQGNDGSSRSGRQFGVSSLLVSAEPLLSFIGNNFLPLGNVVCFCVI